MEKVYKTTIGITGPLIMVEDVKGVKYDELVQIKTITGEIRNGRVLEVSEDKALVQVFEGTDGLDIKRTEVRFQGKGLQIGLSPDVVGRIFDGLGSPIDSLPPLVPEKYLDINGNPINPYSRDFPDDFIQTGLSSIDGLNTLSRGQKLPVFSGSGLPHSRVAAQIARQAKVLRGGGEFAVVFAAMGITFEEAEYFMVNFRKTGAIERAVLFLNLANDPAIERIATPKMALTTAEYLAFEQGKHVLVIMTDMTSVVKDKYDKLIAEGLTPTKRWGYPEDVAKAIGAIAEGRLDFSTGQVINVDGGFHLRRL